MTPKQMDIFNEHHDLCERIANEINTRHGSMNGLCLDDYRQLALMGLCDAIMKYRPARGQFVRYAYKRARGYVYDEIRKADEVGRSRRTTGQRGPTISLEHPILQSDADRVHMLRDILVSPKYNDRLAGFDAIRLLLDGLDREARVIVYLTVVMEMTLGQVSAVLDIPDIRVSKIRRRSIDYLRQRKTLLAY